MDFGRCEWHFVIIFGEHEAREVLKASCFLAARRGNDGKRSASEPTSEGIMENVLFLSREAREYWKSKCF
jgi:hypothetical protein